MNLKKRLITYLTAASLGFAALTGTAFGKSNDQKESLDSLSQSTNISYEQVLDTDSSSDKDSHITYKVQAGDNLIKIANKMSKKYDQNINFLDIAKYNNLSNPNIIHTNSNLLIPITPVDKSTSSDIYQDKNTALDNSDSDKLKDFKDKEDNNLLKKSHLNSKTSNLPLYAQLNNSKTKTKSQDYVTNSDLTNTKISSNSTLENILDNVGNPIKYSKNNSSNQLEDSVNSDIPEKEENTRVRYKVKSGDSYWKIGKLFDTPYKSIQKQNNHKPLHPNQIIEFNIDIESLRGYTADKTANWNLIQTKTPKEIAQDRTKFGVYGLARHLNIKVGEVAVGDERKANMHRDAEGFVTAGKKYNLSPVILAAIRGVESGGRAKTISHTGCLGYDGLTPWVYKGGVWSDGKYREGINPFDSLDSNLKKAEYLRLLVDTYKGLPQGNILAITAYNQGETVMHNLFNEAAKSLNFSSNSYRKTIKHVLDNITLKELFQTKYSSGSRVGEDILSQEGKTYVRKVLNEKKTLKSDTKFMSLIKQYSHNI
jgi:LysM repeat protein